MADFNRKKLQVFVSSTFSDLIRERQAAVEAILAAGHIPAGMELFAAGDESQMQVIKQWIDESDIYLLILGGRYGSVEPVSGKSYTQLEYEYALDVGKPLFACVIKDDAVEARVKAEGRSVIELDNPQKLKAFRAEVLSRMSKFWEDSKDIKITVTETLSHLARRAELRGWVRPAEQSNLPALADEIARLSKENADLRDRIGSRASEDTINGLTFEELEGILRSNGALDFLIQYAAPLSTNTFGVAFEREDGRIVAELSLRGLIRRNDKVNQVYYFITDSGRIFLNKLEARRLSLQRSTEIPDAVKQ